MIRAGLGVVAAASVVIAGVSWVAQASPIVLVGGPTGDYPGLAAPHTAVRSTEPLDALPSPSATPRNQYLLRYAAHRHRATAAQPTPTAPPPVPTQPPAPPPAPPPPGNGSSCPSLGLYVDPQSPSGVAALAQVLHVSAEVVTLYAGGPGWTTFNPPATSMRISLAVGELSTQQAETIGQALVHSGHANTIIRIMWEFNISGYPWSGMSGSAYQAAFQQVVDGFRAVSGQDFTLVWNPNETTASWASQLAAYYPGNAYVNVIAEDLYDNFGGDASVAQMVSFAHSEGKPVGFGEWGLNGTDDPGFIDFMASEILNSSNDFYFQSYFSYAGAIDSEITRFPGSEAAYISEFGGRC